MQWGEMRSGAGLRHVITNDFDSFDRISFFLLAHIFIEEAFAI